jgi:polo-like kinase 1
MSEVPPATSRRPSADLGSDTKLELGASDIKRLKHAEPDAAGHLDAEDKAEFRRVHNDIERSFVQRHGTRGSGGRRESSTASIGVSVNKWVDYSNKYGVGYLLTNNNVGVYFNDSSQIIMSCNAANFEYIERKGLPNAGVRIRYSMTNFPTTLQKKVTLLKHFHAYLKNKTRESPSPSSAVPTETKDMVYVKKWLRTSHAILFRLSNQTVQVIFFDQTEILLSSTSRTVVYTDKSQQISSYPLDTVGESSRADLARRMRYTQDILFHLLSRRGSTRER